MHAWFIGKNFDALHHLLLFWPWRFSHHIPFVLLDLVLLIINLRWFFKLHFLIIMLQKVNGSWSSRIFFTMCPLPLIIIPLPFLYPLNDSVIMFFAANLLSCLSFDWTQLSSLQTVQLTNFQKIENIMDFSNNFSIWSLWSA